MAVALDHVFICTEAGAPAAHRLRALGLTEGSPNHHPGQGTACRRFFFRNAMLELLWVENAAEAQGEQTRGTRLWERCSAAGRGASPFGIVIRPDPEPQRGCPFESWEYRPKTMPDLVLRIATGTELEEPMWCCIESGRAPEEALERLQPVEHPAGFREITGLRILGPPLKETSVTKAMASHNVISLKTGPGHLLELEFDHGQQGAQTDFRPDLPLLCSW